MNLKGVGKIAYKTLRNIVKFIKPLQSKLTFENKTHFYNRTLFYH